MKIFLILSILLLLSNAIHAGESGITMKEIRQEGIVGKIFYPATSEKKPAILVLSGSDGGFYESRARLFAQEGYVALALAYFHVEGLPENLENIPLEYFQKGIRWLKSQPEVQSDKIHLYGPSRGGELVLLLASIFPEEIASVVAVVPSCATYGGIPDETLPAWTLGGQAIPFAPGPGKNDVYKQLRTRETVDLADLFLEELQDKAAFEKALIPVEDIQCPILLISGKEDRMWPSWLYSDLIMQRLDQKRSPQFRKHLCYEKVGHMITHPDSPVITDPIKHPVTGLFYEVGGDPVAQAAACKDAWEEIRRFLARPDPIAP